MAADDVEKGHRRPDCLTAFLDAVLSIWSSGWKENLNWERLLQGLLRETRTTFGLDWVGLFRFSDHDVVQCLAEDPVNSRNTFPAEMALSMFSWFTTKLEKEEIFLVSSPSDLPPEAQAERIFLENRAIRSLFALPLGDGEYRWGVLLGAKVNEERVWLEEEKQCLLFLKKFFTLFRQMSQIVGNWQKEGHFLRLILENMPDVIALKDRQGRFLWTSAFHLQIMGVSRMEEVVGKTDFDFFPPEEAEIFHQDEQKIIRTGKPLVNKLEKAHFQDGTVHWMLTTKVPVRDEHGQVVGVLALARDVTELRQAQENLALGRQFLLTVLNAIPDAVYFKDREHRFLLLNNACARHLGFTSPEELIGKTDFDLHPPELAQRFFEEEERILRAEYAEINVEREADDFSTGTKKRIWILVHKVPVFDEHGRVVGLVGINRDITERKEMEKALLFERNLLRSIIDTIPDHVYVKDVEHRFFLVNQADARHHGFSSPEEMVGKTDFDLHPPELARAFWEEERSILQNGACIFNEEREVDDFSTGHRQRIWIAINKVPFYDQEGNIVGMVGVNRDITARKKAENILRQSEEEKELILNALEDLVIYHDPDLRIIWANQAVLKSLGITPQDLVGKHCYEMIEERTTPCENCAVVRALQTGKPEEGEVISRTGRIWYQRAYPILDESGRVFRLVEVATDITERKKAEERIRYLTFHDPLTGLYNRLFFQEELKRLDSPRQLPLSIIMGDVNNLKLVNDAFGHEAGDELLRRMASILKRACRTEDIVARWGGDEFLILLPQTSDSHARAVVERIRRLCQEASKKDTPRIPLSISLGYATKEKPEEDIRGVLNEAESRMYRHKLVESRSARSALVVSLERSLREISEETEVHSQRLKEIALKMGVALGLSSTELDALELLARLHDLGKLGVDRSILTKPGPLDEKEWEEVKRHPEIGYRIAQSSPELLPVAEGILAHHERFDGRGYPQGLKGEEIPLIARIIAIVDAFDAMISGRPYRNALTPQEAFQEIRRNAGTQFDPSLVTVFFQVMGQEFPDMNSANHVG